MRVYYYFLYNRISYIERSKLFSFTLLNQLSMDRAEHSYLRTMTSIFHDFHCFGFIKSTTDAFLKQRRIFIPPQWLPTSILMQPTHSQQRPYTFSPFFFPTTLTTDVIFSLQLRERVSPLLPPDQQHDHALLQWLVGESQFKRLRGLLSPCKFGMFIL